MKWLSVLVLLLVAVAPARAAPRPAAIDAYLTELRRVEQAAAPVSMEALFNAADEVQAAVMQLSNQQAWLETLSEPEYAALQAELRGFVLSRGYDIYAQPLPAFFLELAERKGGAADVEFFIRYRQYFSADYMPVFQRQGNLPTPCVRYGERILPEVYESWLGYTRKFPGAYALFAPQVVKDVEEMMTLGTCACADEASVMSELRGFLKRFPQNPVAAQVRARLKQLRDDPHQLPVRCR